MATLFILINLVLGMFSSSATTINRHSDSVSISGTSTSTGKFGTVTIVNGKNNPVIVTTDWD